MHKERKTATLIVRVEPSIARALDDVSKGNKSKSDTIRDALLGYIAYARMRNAHDGTNPKPAS